MCDILYTFFIKTSRNTCKREVEMISRSNWDETFSRRFDRHYDELKWLYMELYHGDEAAFDYFCGMLERCYEARSLPLRELDAAREAEPFWYRDQKMAGMQMYADAFAGTLKGVEEKLPYIEECGVNYLHIMPLLESPKGRSDGGYAVADFRKVEPKLGTMDDLASLAAACHKKGISVCLDFVMNHTSEDHAWAKAARAGDPVAQARYFFYDDWTIPNEFEKTVPQVFPQTAPGNFNWCEEAGKVVMTTFHPYQWDLNYANPMVFNDMTEDMLFLTNQGVDVIRLDATPYIWKELGTSCRNLPQVHTLSRMMRMACEIVCPGTLLLGEVVMEPVRVVPYFGTVEKPECHMLYNVTTMASTWHTVATHDVRLLEHQLASVFALPKQYTFLNYLRCHDDIGWGLDYGFLKQFEFEEVAHKKFLNDWFTGKFPGSPSRGELYNDDPRLGDARMCGTTASLCGIESDPAGIDLDLMLHAFLFIQSGIPVIYSGDEIGRLNDNTYHDDPDKAEDSRYLHRGAFPWKDAGKRNDKKTVEGKLFTAIRRMEKLRCEHRAFNADADMALIDTGSTAVLGIRRSYGGETVLAFFNFGGEEERVILSKETVSAILTGGPETSGSGIPACRDLMTGRRASAKEVVLPPYGFRWIGM